MVPEMLFGFMEGEQVRLYEFILDPNGTDLPWLKPTQERITLENLVKISQGVGEYHGQCFDTGEYYSHKGELAQKLIDEAPPETKLVLGVHFSAPCGTRTFKEILTVDYYR